MARTNVVMRLLSAMCIIVFLLGFAPGARAAEATAEQEKNITAMQAVLPQFEKAADECEKALQPFMGSKEPKVIAAVDAALLRIIAIREMRPLIALSPKFAKPAYNDRLERWKEGMDYYFECARSGNDPFEGMTTGLRGVRSKIDGDVVMYRFTLPKDYNPSKKYPLDVYLHGAQAKTRHIDWVYGKPADNPQKTLPTRIASWSSIRIVSEPCGIVIEPCGRGNNSYQAMGSVAVLEVMQDCMKHYLVDEDRIYIGGASMGSSGAGRLAPLYPDLFAGVHMLTGPPDYNAFVYGDGRFDALAILDNFCNTPLCNWLAAKDQEGIKFFLHQKMMTDGIKELEQKYPGHYPHLTFNDPNGKHSNVDQKMMEEGRTWVLEQKRNPYPKLVIYKTYSLRYDGAYWLRIDMTQDACAPARIEAELQEGNKLRVAVENVARFHVDLVKELVGEVKSIAATINGAPAIEVPSGKTVYFAQKGAGWCVADKRYPEGLVKKHGLSGPFMDVFMENPVLMVYGTLDGKVRAVSLRMVDKAVDGILGGRLQIIHAPFERKADVDITKEDIATKNLVLFGTPKQNAVLRDIADKLPIKFLDDGVEIAGKQHRKEGIGLVMVYPNPLNTERYVLILPEGWRHSITAALDYAVMGGSQPIVKDKSIEEGCFDSYWRIAPKN